MGPLQRAKQAFERLFRWRSGALAAALLALLAAVSGCGFVSASGGAAGLRESQAGSEQHGDYEYGQSLHSILSFKGSVAELLN